MHRYKQVQRLVYELTMGYEFSKCSAYTYDCTCVLVYYCCVKCAMQIYLSYTALPLQRFQQFITTVQTVVCTESTVNTSLTIPSPSPVVA
jgi:hypothetical protein